MCVLKKLLVLSFGYAQGHTTEICTVVDRMNVDFYACSYHSINERGIVGGVYVDGVRYNFNDAALIGDLNISSDATCSRCPTYNGNNRFCQMVTVTGLSDGLHTVGTTCDTVVECPWCNFPDIEITGITPPNECDQDTEPPNILCLERDTLVVDNTCTTVLPNYINNAIACDKCSNVTFEQFPQYGSLLGTGTHHVITYGTDLSGNTNGCVTMVDVVDNTPPNIILTYDPSQLWPPNHKMVKVNVTTVVTDNCDFNVLCRIDNVVVSNEDDDATGDGNTENDWNILDNRTVMLRAERKGEGNGRIYTISVLCNDNNGNQAIGVTHVAVQHNN